jgi:tetratricopeptide (TPR) repeat protein
MKCPRCGATNGKTNKFCRGCGLRLEDLAAVRQAGQRSEQVGTPDEVALGEELFEVWQLYSQAELDAALAKAEKILESTPESASAHSILALIHERKAEGRFKAGSDEEARGFLKLAIEQYERIIDLNPDSAADREKLASLRMRLTGQASAAPIAGLVGLRAALKAVPTPVLAGFGAFLVVLMAAIILVPGGERERRRAAPAAEAAKVSQVSTAGAAAARADAGGGSRVYTFPAPEANQYGSAFPTPPPPVPEPRRLNIPTEPAKLPALVGANVKIVPEGKTPAKKPDASARSAKEEKPKPAVEEKPSARPDGDTALARAVELRRQGVNAEAIVAAQEAIKLYQADIDASRNTTSANRGLENAKKIIQLSREAEAESSGSQ